MSRRLRFSQRRRRLLSLQIAEHLDQALEPRSTVTPAITAAPAISAIASVRANGWGGY